MKVMKTPEEYFKLWKDGNISIYELICTIHKEVYNQAIQDAVENGRLKKVKIPYEGVRAGGYYIVNEIDKDSILNLKK